MAFARDCTFERGSGEKDFQTTGQTARGSEAGSSCFRGRGRVFLLSRRRGDGVVPLMKGSGPDVALVNRNVETGLAEFLFDIDFAFSLEDVEGIARPVNLASAQTTFGDIDRRAGEVRTGDVAHSRCSVAVCPHQMLLVLDGAHGRTDFKGVMKLRLMGA